MITPDQKAFERLIRNYLSSYAHLTKSMETAWEVYKDDYGKALFTAPYVKVVLKDDAEILAELQDNRAIRVVQHH